MPRLIQCFSRLLYNPYVFLASVSFFLSVLSFSPVFSQTATVVVDANNPKHETLSQQRIDVLFSESISGTTDPSQWTVLINGSSTGISVTGVSNSSTTAFVTFDASGATGHGGTEKYVKPGEVLTVSYSGNTLTTLSTGNIVRRCYFQKQLR
jgi:hypothetical protein